MLPLRASLSSSSHAMTLGAGEHTSGSRKGGGSGAVSLLLLSSWLQRALSLLWSLAWASNLSLALRSSSVTSQGDGSLALVRLSRWQSVAGRLLVHNELPTDLPCEDFRFLLPGFTVKTEKMEYHFHLLSPSHLCT